MRRRDGEIEFEAPQFRVRARMLAGLLALIALVLIGRSVQLQVFDQQFIAKQADMRHARTAKLEAHRGAILDRFGEPLAVSSPVDTVWVNPPEFAEAGDGIEQLARALKLNRQWLGQRVTSNLDREFLYVARHLEPDEAAKIRKLKIPGVYFLREYKRFYPNGEVTGHLLGFTNLDEAGLEGLEFAYDRSLAGMDGAKRVLVNGRGQVIQNVEVLKAPRAGRGFRHQHRPPHPVPRVPRAQGRDPRAPARARAPSSCSTSRRARCSRWSTSRRSTRTTARSTKSSRYRNRAVTDIFEPGSSIKPFVVAAALASGRYSAGSMIDAKPFKVGSHAHPRPPRPRHDQPGRGARALQQRRLAKIALSLDKDQMHDSLGALGFGKVTESGFPGESAGLLVGHRELASRSTSRPWPTATGCRSRRCSSRKPMRRSARLVCTARSRSGEPRRPRLADA